MLRKGETGKRIYFDTEKNVMIAVFENKNIKKKYFGIVSITELKGDRKGQIDMTLPAFERMMELINRMPQIEIKGNGRVTMKEEKKK